MISLRGDHKWNAMIGAIRTYKMLHDFIVITIVKDGEKYASEMDEFEKNVVEFYKYGKDLFLIGKNGKEGGNKTAYLHTLQFYCPTLARRVWDNLKVGLGVFNTQGVKACNKQSKAAWDHCTNDWKHKQTQQVMQPLHALFMN